jgi:uncharacterized membrane protein YedE/YeeE
MKAHAAVSFFCGVLFALGLGISGMTQPAKVTAFLDFFGAWNPSLAFVMAGAILVYALGYRWVVRRPKPLFPGNFQIPSLRKVDRPLAIGSALFGAGWGLAGFCPGPALTSLASLQFEPLLFLSSMLAGMILFEASQRWRKA